MTSANVVVGGEATFLARYFANGTELFGHGTLTSTATAGITTGTVSPSFAIDRDFLQVTVPGDAMSGTVSLLVDDVVVGELPVAAVPTSDVTHVAILGQNDVGAATGASMALYAHAVDPSSADVFGASFAWGTSADSLETQGPLSPVASAAQGPSDLFFYSFDGTVSETVVARYDGFSPGAVIHARGGSVGSTAAVGCSVAALGATGASPSFGALGLLLAGGALARRRARASAAA